MPTGREHLYVDVDNKLDVRVLTEATTINTTSDPDSIFGLDGTAAGFAVTLPDVADAIGCKYYFYFVANTNSVTVESPTKVMYGGIVFAGTTGASTAASAEDIVTFVASTGKVGDWVEIISNGTTYMLAGYCATAGGITATASA